MSPFALPLSYTPALQTRHLSRTSTLTTTTASLSPTHIQANLIVLPSAYADSFRELCRRNPVPCPLLGETVEGRSGEVRSYVPRKGGVQRQGWSKGEGGEGGGRKQEWERGNESGGKGTLVLAEDMDLATDAPGYMIYAGGRVVKGGKAGKVLNITREWTPDHIGFLIGCSFSFESALVDAGLVPSHHLTGKTVPMYRTNIPLNPAGVFTNSTYVVSMRPYKCSDIERVRDITRPYGLCHGEPIAWGWEAVAKLGIQDLQVTQWGDAPGLMRDADGEELVPVFWGCGVTPQEAVMRAGERIEGVVMGHEPGHMIVLDARDWDIVSSGA